MAERVSIFKRVDAERIGEWTQFKQAITALPQNLSRADIHQIHNAHVWERQAHEGQKRRTGEPYAFHPIRAALIGISCAEIDPNLSVEEIAFLIKVLLLHDVFEDTNAKVRGRRKGESFYDFELRAVRKMADKFPREVPLGVQSMSEPIVDGIVIFSKEGAKVVQEQRIVHAPSLIQVGKSCDSLDNLRTYVKPAHKRDERSAREDKIRETERLILPILQDAAEDYPVIAGYMTEEIKCAIVDLRKKPLST